MVSNEEVNEIEHEDELVEATEKNGCTPGEACEAGDFFEMITQCTKCGKLC